MRSRSESKVYTKNNYLLVRPIAWSVMEPDAIAIKEDPILIPSIEIFGYTKDGRSAYVRVPRNSTYILRFKQEIDEDLISNIREILNPINIKRSEIDNRTISVRACKISPIEFINKSEYEGIASLAEVIQNPYGELEAFWETIEIGPYEWIVIKSFAPLPGRYTSCDLNITANELEISSIDKVSNFINLNEIQLDIKNTLKLLFWNIGVFSSNINSCNLDDMIFMISVITVNNGDIKNYIIVKGNVSYNFTCKIEEKNILVIKVNSEKELLLQFLYLYKLLRPDKQIYYNGNIFDMPYLLNRLEINSINIPKITKVLRLQPKIINPKLATSFGLESSSIMDLHGTEIIDLSNYYRRFYPHFRNYEINNIVRLITGDDKKIKTKLDCKTDKNLHSDNKVNYVIESNELDCKTDKNLHSDNKVNYVIESNELERMIEYYYGNNRKVYELWNYNDTMSEMESVCNNLGISINTLLTESFDKIIDIAAYNIDIGAVMISGNKESPSHIKESVKGIYRNISIYDYSELYRQILLRSDQYIASLLGLRLENAPPNLILTAFYSKYVDRTNLSGILEDMLDNIITTNMIISIEPTIIRSIGPLNNKYLKHLENISCYVSLENSNHIIIDERGNVEKIGFSKLCRPKFELANKLIDEYLNLIAFDSQDNFHIPDLEHFPIEMFHLNEKIDIGDTSIKEIDSFKYKLRSQYGAPITTSVSVKYVMTLKGPILLSQLSPDIILNYSFYQKQLKEYFNYLQSLKIYGT